ncbi:carboxypeptidase regulatory-like domain-containing protein [Edaphobacter paludis]|uniref:Carboxypeptidase regulatory-like domain-containing protein n=1 Tax=Edaphobacter paludis TaxID=3035702 RepID=A0AAU7D8P8_9BACT
MAQVDQGAVTGVVTDSTGAAIANAKVTLNATDTGLALERETNGNGIYTFSPVKIGKYSVSATAPGFTTTTRENLVVDIQARISVNLTLKLGSVSDTVTVSTAPPLLETQTGAVGQVVTAKEINDTPLNGRNWVYIAQLTAGVAPPFGGTRGSGKGDFVANGQRAEQNNFILDGVDNNTNLVDFLNGSTYVQRPPPDALAEFNLQTSNYSAEFGHSAGAVMNASIKSGTNNIHGDIWEYFRSDKLNAKNWNALTIPEFHQNQFGATLGFPVWKDKLFYFGDIEVNRVVVGNTGTYTVPTALMRQGNFSELLNPTLTGQNQAVVLYQPGTGGTALLACNGQQNVFCASQINAVAKNILNLYPMPNANGNKTYNNYIINTNKNDNTVQWDQRMDYNITHKDQLYGRFSYVHEIVLNTLPLGPVLDGSPYGGEHDTNLAENGMFSETHTFGPTTVNEFRFGYNWGQFSFLQPNATNYTLAASLGLGNVPASPYEGGLPQGNVSNLSTWGSQGTSTESQNVYQILDNLTKTMGNHSLKMGVALENIRFYYTYAQNPRGSYTFSGNYTSLPGTSYTGYGVADFLADQMKTAYLTNAPGVHDQNWYDSGYVQDDWRVTSKLALNLGVRYDWYEPYRESRDRQSNFVVTGSEPGHGTALYQLPSSAQKYALSAPFLALLAKDNVAVQYVNNARLVSSQYTNFAPRVGFSYSLDPKTVIRGGFGIFYGGLQSEGNTNLGTNYPFSLTYSVPTPTCAVGNCPAIPYTLESGLPVLTTSSSPSQPGFHASDLNMKTPYTENYSLSFQRALTSNLVASIAYVGNESRHLSTYWAPNSSQVLLRSGVSTLPYQAFPDLGGTGQIQYTGFSDYNSLQAKLEKRFSRGLTFLTTYTWAHAMDDSSSAGGLSSGIGVRSYFLLGIPSEYTNSTYDVRNRYTLNGNYELPVGQGRAHLNSSRLLDVVIGGWSASATFAAQSGTPFSVGPSNSTAAGGSARAVRIRDPFSPGGSGANCSASVRTRTHYYNPCAFTDPLPGNLICPVGTRVGTVVAGVACTYAGPIADPKTALAFLGGKQNQVYGPGYWRADMSLFKNFITVREQYLQFRVDGFNVFNHPTWANPSTANTSASAGLITSPKTFQANTPDARFLQLSAKYIF